MTGIVNVYDFENGKGSVQYRFEEEIQVCIYDEMTFKLKSLICYKRAKGTGGGNPAQAALVQIVVKKYEEVRADKGLSESNIFCVCSACLS